MAQRSLMFRAALLGSSVLIAAAFVLPLGWAINGTAMGLVAGASAGGTCLLAVWLALIASEPLRNRGEMLGVVIVGMLIRMAIPLAAFLFVYFQRGPLADAGFVYYLITFYPVTLAAETFVTLPGRRADDSGAAVKRSAVD